MLSKLADLIDIDNSLRDMYKYRQGIRDAIDAKITEIEVGRDVLAISIGAWQCSICQEWHIDEPAHVRRAPLIISKICSKCQQRDAGATPL